MSKHLELGVNDLSPSYQKQPPDHPRFFHFSPKISPVAFHNADTIVFKRDGKPDYIIRDRYGKLSK